MDFAGKDRLEVHSAVRAVMGDSWGDLFETLTEIMYGHLLKVGDTAVDCGANIGRHAIGMARSVGPTGQVVAFEPQPTVLPWLRTSLAEAKVIDIVDIREVALGNFVGTTTFFANHGWAHGMSGLRPRELDESIRDRVTVIPIEVSIRRLDDELKGISKVAFIKLDLEGGELDALRGGEQILLTHRPPIVFENGRSSSATDYGYSAEDFYGFFGRVGYRLYDIFGYDFGQEDWTRGSMPWQFMGFPTEKPLTDELRAKLMLEIEATALNQES